MIWRLFGIADHEAMIALRYLRSKREEGFISIVAWFSLLGIMLGVGTLIVVMSMFNGFREELLSRIIDMNGHVTVSNLERYLTEYEVVADRLAARDDVLHAVPMVQGQAMAAAGNASSGALVLGIDPKDFAAREFLFRSLKDPNSPWLQDGDGVLVGARMAENLGLSVGDDITLISPNGVATPFGTVPRVKTYQVGGLFEFGMYQFDRSYMYMPLEDAQIFFKTGPAAGSIELTLTDRNEARSVAFEVRQILGSGYTAADWNRVNTSFFKDLEVQRNVISLVLSLIVLVACFNIISSQMMMVRDKTLGIAIFRTVGASRASILRIFILTGSMVGFVGTLLGAIGGITFAANIEIIRRALENLFGIEVFDRELYYLSELPATINPIEVGFVVLSAFLISVLASLYPAWRAARLDPVEVLRYE